MSLTPEQIAQGWRPHDGSGECPIKDNATIHQIMEASGWESPPGVGRRAWNWRPVIAYRIIEAHGADAEPARPTPFPRDYSDLVFSPDGWSQTIIVDGKRPEWLRDDDECTGVLRRKAKGWRGRQWTDDEIAIRVRRREPKRETVQCIIHHRASEPLFGLIATIDLIDGKPDLSTLKIAEDAL